MVALTAERRTPFQIRPIERPFNRFLPAVDKMKSNVMQTIRRTGDVLAQRMHRSHVEDSARLRNARATIATQIYKPSVPKVLLHGAAEAAKNSAPAMIVGAGARVALGTVLGAQALTVAAGVSAVSRGVREAIFTIRKGTFAEITKHISKHEEASTLKNFNGTTREAHTGIRAQQDRFAQTDVGKVVNAVLHGGEKKIAEFAYGKQRHARALVQAQELDIRSLTDKELIALRQHAVMARMTHGTAADVYAMRQLAKTTYQAVNAELRNNRSIKPQEAHELQLRLYKRDVRRGAVLNVVGQGVLAAAKAVPKTIGTFFAVEDIMRVLHITSHRHNPLEGLDQSMLGHAVQNAKASVSNVDLKQKFAHVGDNAIAWIGKVIAPKSVAYADELMPDTSSAVQTTASSVRHATRAVHASTSTSDWTHGAGAHATRDPRITEHTEIVKGKTMVTGSGVLTSESPKPMGVPSVPDPTPLVVEVDERHVVRAVAQVQEHVKTPQVVTTIVHEQIGGKTSLTQDIFDRKLIPGMESAPDAVTWYGQSGTAAQMMQHIIIPNSDKLTPDQITQLQEYVNAHPDASFGALWHANRNVFTGGMDTWTMGTGYNVAVDHVVSQQDTLAAAQIARVEQVDNAGWGKVPGHAKEVVRIAVNSPQQQTDGPGVVLTPTQGTGADTTHYQIVRPPQGARVSGVGNTSQGSYQQVAPPGGRTAASNTVNGFQQVRKPGEAIAHGSNTNTQIGTPSQNGVVPSPHPTGSHETSGSVANSTNGYQQVAPPQGVDVIHNSSNSSFQQVGQPTSPRPIVPVHSTNETYQIVSPPKPQDNVNFQEVSLPRATEQYETSSDIRTASVMNPFDLGSGNSHVAYLESTSPYFPSSSSMPISMLNDRAPAIGAGAYEYNALGGTNIWTHTSSFKEGGKQWLEDVRVYMQGGNGQPRLGPVQQLRRAQELMQSAPHLFINIDNQHQGGFSLTGVHHLLLNKDGSLNLASTDGIIGGGPDTISFIGCSYGHVQAIQMIIDHSAEAPPHLNQWFGILNDPYATGENVENAVNQIVKQWFRSTEYYSDFYKLYGYLLEEIPTPGTSEYSKFLNNLADNGYMSSGRLEFEFSTGGQ